MKQRLLIGATVMGIFMTVGLVLGFINDALVTPWLIVPISLGIILLLASRLWDAQA